MVYQHSDDISENEKTYIPKLDEQMKAAVYRIKLALDALENVNNDFRGIVGLLLESFLFTHKSIFLLLLKGNEEKYGPNQGKEEDQKSTDMTLSADAMSLVREQVEKVFTITLLCDDPDKWSQVYIKDDWRRFYEQYLLQRDETKNLPRFQEFHGIIAPDRIEEFKRRGTISDENQEAIEFKYYNEGEEIPSHLKPFMIELFPTPGQAKNLVKDANAKSFLQRWHKEYKFLSGYNHGVLLKIYLLSISDRKFAKLFSQSEKETFYKKQILLPALWTSYTACASACTETLKYLPYNVEVLAALTFIWETLQKGSLLARAIWAMRAKHLFPQSVL